MSNEKFASRAIGAIASAVIVMASLGAMAQTSTDEARGITEGSDNAPNASREFRNETAPSGSVQIESLHNERNVQQDHIQSMSPEQRQKELKQQRQQSQTDGSSSSSSDNNNYTPGVDVELQR